MNILITHTPGAYYRNYTVELVSNTKIVKRVSNVIYYRINDVIAAICAANGIDSNAYINSAYDSTATISNVVTHIR